MLHFDHPYHHAKHYCGFTTRDVMKRIDEHMNVNSSKGSGLVKAVIRNGIGVKIGAVYVDSSTDLERKIKRSKNTRRFCKICNKEPITKGENNYG